MARSITFTLDGPVDSLISITELSDGTLRFDVEILGSGSVRDLRGLFFDLGDIDASTVDLKVTGINGSEAYVGRTSFDEAAVSKVKGDVNVKGKVAKAQGDFDVGIEFGTAGIARDSISEASFILSSEATELSLDSLDLADFGLRIHSLGNTAAGDRNGNAKVADDASGVARNDVFEVDENTSGTVDLLLNDTNGTQEDGTRKTVISVQDATGALSLTAGGFERTVVIDGLVLGTLLVTTDGYATFSADGADVDKLGHDAMPTWSFTYETASSEGNLATADVVLTIDGQNDQPAAFDVALRVGEDDAFDTTQNPDYQTLTGDGVTGRFIGTDIDIGDVLSFQIISAPTDAFGNQYGEVVNNGDGTFTFNPTDEFQFLAEGETRDVTFQYVAIDDSGVGTSPGSPEETDTSKPATITVTVEGAEDAPINFSDEYVFTTNNQSMFGTGEALTLQPKLPFLGFNTGYRSLDATIYEGLTLSGSTLEGILDGIEAIADFFAGLFGEDVDLPDSITIPSITTDGGFSAKVGLQPYFSFNSGAVDGSIPVDVMFTVPRQVENGDTFVVQSVYSIDDGATFSTMSPNVNFGMDFVFDIDTDLDLLIGSSRFDIWDVDTGNYANFKGELGLPGFNLFNATADDLEIEEIELGDIATLSLNFPVINTFGELVEEGSETLQSEGEDDIAVLDIDIDEIAALAIKAATGVEISFGDSDSEGLTTDVFGETLNLVSFEYSWDIVAVNLITTLKAIQEFSLQIMDLPLIATLEDGSTITGFSLGDEITVQTPDDSLFDADVDGNADGLMGIDVAVDMDAIFSNLSYLGLDIDLFTGLLQLSGGITSSFFDGPSISLFDGIIPSVDGNDDGFLFGRTTSLLSDVPLATLFEDDFAIEGWNTQNTDFAFDIA